MKHSEIEKILKGGSVRAKIILYLTDSAMFHVSEEHVQFEVLADDLGLKKNINITGSKLLSSKERNLLWSSIKDPKDIEYYNKLRVYNQSFLFFKEKFTAASYRIAAIAGYIKNKIDAMGQKEDFIDVVNELLELYTDKKTREKALNLAIKKIKGGVEYQKGRGEKYLEAEDLPEYFEELKTKGLISAVEYSMRIGKMYIETFKLLLEKELPLKPYREWVKREEEKLKKNIEFIHEFTVNLESYPENFPRLSLYDEIKNTVSEEELDSLKNWAL